MEQFISVAKDYAEFKSKTNSSDMLLFADWIKVKYAKDSSFRKPKDELITETKIMHLIGDVSECMDRLIRISISEAGIKSKLDVKVLLAVSDGKGKITKKDLVAGIVAERTTIIESIKRLNKKELLFEVEGQKKGTRILRLTKTGKSHLKVIKSRQQKIANLVSSSLSHEQKEQLQAYLHKVCNLQESMHHASREEIVALLDL